MSVVVIRTINCDRDAPDCQGWIFESIEAADVLRRQARKLGWLVSQPGGRDYCPSCAARRRSSAASEDSGVL